MRRYIEDKVDSMRQQKDEELEQYKKEIERAKRFEAQKGAGLPASVLGSEKITVKRKVINPSTQTGTEGATRPIQKKLV